MADESTPSFVAARIRAEAAEVKRLAELYAKTDEGRLAAQQQILELEEQALAIERNIAKTKEQQLKADEKLKQNAHEKAKLEQQRAEVEAKRQTEQSQFEAAQLRAIGAETKRNAELNAKTTKEQYDAKQRVLDLERQALELEKQRAQTPMERLRADEALKNNAHEQTRLAKERQEALDKESSIVTKMSSGAAILKNWWQEIAVAVYGVVRGIREMDEMMETAFTQRSIMGNLPFEIDQTRTATMGLVGDMDLARVAVQANRFGVAQNSEDMAKLAEAATKLGLSVGKDAASSVEDLTLALARNSPMILDNLGIVLKKSQAITLYAEKLGKAEDALTAQERAEAFMKIGLDKAKEAADKVTLSVTDQERAWISARQTWDQLVRETIPAVTSETGEMWSAMAEGGEIARDMLPLLSGALKLLGVVLKPVVFYFSFWAKQMAILGRLAGELGDVVDFLGDKASEAGDAASKWFDEWGGEAAQGLREMFSGLAEEGGGMLTSLRESVEEQIPAVKNLTGAWDILKHTILDIPISSPLLKPVAEAVEEVNKHKAKQQYFLKAEEAAEAAKLAYLEEQVKDTEFAVKLGEAQGKSAKDLEAAYQEQLSAKIALLGVTEGQAAVEELLRDEQVRQAKAEAKARKGKGSGPTEADRVKAAGEIQLKIWEDRINLIELEARLRDNLEDTAVYESKVRYAIALEELKLEKEVLAVTRAKNSVEREKNAARIEAIEREMELLRLEQELEDRERANELVDAAAKATKEQAEINAEFRRQEAAGIAEVISLQDFRFKRREQQIQHEGAMAQATARNDIQRLLAAQETERALHDNRMRMRRAEYEAQLRDIEARQSAAEAMDVIGDPDAFLKQQDEFRQIAHDREMSRLEFEMDMRRAMEAEQVAMLQREKARVQQQLAMLDQGLSAFEEFRGQATQLAGFFTERNNAEEDAALQRTISNLESRGEAQKAAIEAEIEAAEGNVDQQNKLRRKAAQQERALQRQIELAQAQHEDRRKRQEMRAAGTQMMITGAVETVKAVAAFASFNYIEGALHTAAAAVAFTQGAMLLAGKIPGGGAVAALGNGGGGGMSAGDSGQEYVDPSSVPGSVPGEAARRESATPQANSNVGGGNTVVLQIGTVMGTLDEDACKNLARQIEKSKYAREA